MISRLATVLASSIVIFGVVLLYDAALVPLLRRIFDSPRPIGFDLKEFSIGLVAMAVGLAWLHKLLEGNSDRRLIAVGLILFGLLVPLLFQLEIHRAIWFTDRDYVTALSGDLHGETRAVRSRYVQYLDESDAQRVRVDDFAAEASRLEAELRAVSKAVEAARAEAVRVEAPMPDGGAQALTSTPNSPEPTLTLNDDRVADTTQPPSTSADRLLDEYPLNDACGNGNDVLPDSTALVENATGSVRAPSLSYSADADSLLLRAIDLDPGNAIAYSRLGLLYLKVRQQPSMAIDIYRRALTEMPDCSALHSELGSAYAAEADYSSAKTELLKAIALTEEVPASYYYNLANAFLKSGDAEGSIGHYLHALEVNPSHEKARVNLTRAYIEERRTRELYEMYATDADALRRIGVTLNRENDPEAALRFFLRSLAVEEDVETYVQIGIAYGMSGRMIEATNAAKRALMLEPGHEGALAVLRLADN